MFEYTYKYIYGILGYEDYSWYYRIFQVLILPIGLTLSIVIDVISFAIGL
jgi:hypothetical protein